jgi:DnaJ domain
MSQFDSSKDYYDILGAEEGASPRDIERLYKRLAARRHPDRGGSEDEMKSLNEAYGVLKDEAARRVYDSQRRKPRAVTFTPASAPPARDVGLYGQSLSAFLCLMTGLFLLFLVRFQWIWFLWPLAILAVFVIVFGILLAHGAMLSFNESLPLANPLRRHTLLQEAVFWTIVGGSGYGVYLLLSV